MSDEEDRQDVRRVLEGDVDAFAGIVARWQGPLHRLAWRYCHDRARAEDLAQEALVRAYRSLATWRGEGAFSTWLFALALNVCRAAIRHLPPEMEQVLEAPEVADPSSARPEERVRDREVRRAVLRLPARYRDALLLFYFHDMDLGEAAATLRVPEGTLKARLHRGREQLRARLAGAGSKITVAEEVS